MTKKRICGNCVFFGSYSVCEKRLKRVHKYKCLSKEICSFYKEGKNKERQHDRIRGGLNKE